MAWPPASMAAPPDSTASTTASPRPTPTIDMTASTAMAPPTTCGMPTLLCSKLLLCHNWQELRPARRPLNRPLRARSSRPVASTIRFWNTSAARYRCTHGPIAHSAQWLYPSWGTGYLRQPSPIVGLRRAFRRQLCWVTQYCRLQSPRVMGHLDLRHARLVSSRLVSPRTSRAQEWQSP